MPSVARLRRFIVKLGLSTGVVLTSSAVAYAGLHGPNTTLGFQNVRPSIVAFGHLPVLPTAGSGGSTGSVVGLCNTSRSPITVHLRLTATGTSASRSALRITISDGVRTLYAGSLARLDQLDLGQLAAGASMRIRVGIRVAAGLTHAVQGGQAQVATRWLAAIA